MKAQHTSRDLAEFERRIGVEFKNKDLLRTALTHRSYLNENSDATDHNERLEFLGDAVIEVVVSLHLYKSLRVPEGRMTNLRALMVSARALGKVGEQLGIEQYVRCSRGMGREMERDPRVVRYLRGCAVEAVVGAVRVDRGMGIAELFVHEFLLARLNEIKNAELRDPKSFLQELAQERWRKTPVYGPLTSVGPDHKKQFTVGLYIGNKAVGTGTGPSIADAETAAARKALKELFKIDLAIWDEWEM